ncbi:hypothetical protein RFI_38304, partial [Reticulomyxa filosa]
KSEEVDTVTLSDSDESFDEALTTAAPAIHHLIVDKDLTLHSASSTAFSASTSAATATATAAATVTAIATGTISASSAMTTTMTTTTTTTDYKKKKAHETGDPKEHKGQHVLSESFNKRQLLLQRRKHDIGRRYTTTNLQD